MIAHVNPRARIPAIQGQFGPRVVTYTTQMPVSAIETILGHDPRSVNWHRLPDDLAYIYNHLQRATTKARLASIIRYIRYRFIERPVVLGAFPAISVAVQNPTPFKTYEDIPDSGVGVLEFDLSRRNNRILVDGLGRVGAGLDLIEMTEKADLSDIARLGLQQLLSEFSLPVVFYLPAPGMPPFTLEEMQQLFHDFNFKATRVKDSIAIALDHSDVYIGLTNRLGRSSVIQSLGGMEFKSSSLGKKSTAIVVQQNLLRFVRGGAEGERFLEGTNKSELPDPNLTEDTLDEFEDQMESFLTYIVEGMGAEKFKNRAGLHLTSPGWGALGVVFHDLVVRLRVPNYQAAARKLGSIDWDRSNPLWAEIIRERTDNSGNVTLGLAAGGAQNRRFLTRRLREILAIDQLLAERGFAEQSTTDKPEAVDVLVEA